jgi:ornithine cyclodeaminase/alanine dehydrogenase-like protein (mu-crystallin family)
MAEPGASRQSEAVPSLPFVDAATLNRLLSWPQAIDALGAALEAGLDVTSAPPRTRVTTARGELLLMPAESGAAVGVKLVGIAPGNADLGLPRIQALYVLLDAATLAPRMLIDGAALTTLRTPAVSALAVRDLAAPDAATLTVFGSGPQAGAHVDAIRAIRPITAVTVVARHPGRAEALATRLRADGLDAVTGGPDDVRAADIVVCATDSPVPLFEAALLGEQACVLAVGSHQPDRRELAGLVFARAARVVVEDRATALREAGDIVLAVEAGLLSAADLVPLAELPGRAPVTGISVFKSVGMGWQDLVVAEAVGTALDAGR